MSHAMRRIAPWEAILGAFSIKHVLRTVVKGQVLTDLVIEIAESPTNEMIEA